MKVQKPGFTLIELLIVIAIIGLLSAIGVAYFSGAQRQARDTKRLNDIKSLQEGISIYFHEKAIFPDITSGNTWDGDLASDLANYLSQMPMDPDDSAGEEYIYVVDNANHNQMYVVATLEEDDAQALTQDVDGTISGSGWESLSSQDIFVPSASSATIDCNDPVFCLHVDASF